MPISMRKLRSMGFVFGPEYRLERGQIRLDSNLLPRTRGVYTLIAGRSPVYVGSGGIRRRTTVFTRTLTDRHRAHKAKCENLRALLKRGVRVRVMYVCPEQQSWGDLQYCPCHGIEHALINLGEKPAWNFRKR
jgi:hypothetical protein